MEEFAMTINKDMYIADVLNEHRNTVPIFFRNGLHCIGCVMASGETIEEACLVHGLNCDQLLIELNDFIADEADGQAEA